LQGVDSFSADDCKERFAPARVTGI